MIEATEEVKVPPGVESQSTQVTQATQAPFQIDRPVGMQVEGIEDPNPRKRLISERWKLPLPVLDKFTSALDPPARLMSKRDFIKNFDWSEKGSIRTSLASKDLAYFEKLTGKRADGFDAEHLKAAILTAQNRWPTTQQAYNEAQLKRYTSMQARKMPEDRPGISAMKDVIIEKLKNDPVFDRVLRFYRGKPDFTKFSGWNWDDGKKRFVMHKIKNLDKDERWLHRFVRAAFKAYQPLKKPLTALGKAGRMWSRGISAAMSKVYYRRAYTDAASMAANFGRRMAQNAVNPDKGFVMKLINRGMWTGASL